MLLYLCLFCPHMIPGQKNKVEKKEKEGREESRKGEKNNQRHELNLELFKRVLKESKNVLMRVSRTSVL